MSESMNRAFMYGESVFTTMRMVEGKLQDWDLHFERLKKGVEFVYGPFSDETHWTELLKSKIMDKIPADESNKIVRLTVYLEQERGLAQTKATSAQNLKIAITASPCNFQDYEKKAFRLRTCAAPVKPLWWPAFLKAGSYLETIILQKMHLQAGDDDLLFVSPETKILESSVANIFILKQNKLLTPPLGPQVLDGVMRRKVIESSDTVFDSSQECEITLNQLLKADAIFGTNSIRGPFLIDRIDSQKIHFTEEFLLKFNLLRQRVLT